MTFAPPPGDGPAPSRRSRASIKLPPLRSGLARGRALLAATAHPDGSYRITRVSSDLPAVYVESFRRSFRSPIMVLAAKHRTVESVEVVLSRSDLDSASFQAYDKRIRFDLGGDVKKRMFRSSSDVEMVATHEATHALNWYWDAVLEDGGRYPSSLVRSRVHEAQQACMNLNQAVADRWLRQHQELLSRTLRDFASELSNRGKAESDITDPHARSAGPLAMRRAASAFRDLSDRLDRGQMSPLPSNALDRGSRKEACADRSDSIVDELLERLPLDALDALDASQWKTLRAIDDRFQSARRQRWACVTESDVLRTLGPGRRPAAERVGHPWENLTEMASSVVTSTAYGGERVDACVNRARDPYLAAEVLAVQRLVDLRTDVAEAMRAMRTGSLSVVSPPSSGLE